MDERTEKSLGMLKSYVLNDAHKTGDGLTEESKNRVNARLDAERARLAEKFSQQTARELEASKRENKAKLQAAEQAARKELIECRKRITDEIFAEVREKILAFKKTDEYRSWLNKTAQRAFSDCGEAAEFYVSEDDIEKLEAQNKSVKLMLGGVIACNPEKGVTADYSVDTLLREARDEFLRSSGLTIEI